MPRCCKDRGNDGGTIGFPTLEDGNGDRIPGPYMKKCLDHNTVEVYKPDAYTYTGKFQIEVYVK